MKKLFMIAFALVFSTGIAFAQDNEAIIEQAGNGSHYANVDQTSDAVGDNFAKVVQYRGSDGDTRVTQIGDENRALAESGDNAVVRQYQEGNNNIAQLQRGNQSQSLIQQAELRQRQEGDGNVARTIVNGPGTRFVRVVQRQYGDGNVSVLDGLRGNTSFGTDAFTLQDGDHNTARAIWHGNSQNNSLDVRQFGDGNTARIDFFTKGNRAVVDQSGGMNTAIINQN